MNILVCVKRVPAIGAKPSLTADEQEIDARYLGFTVSPHEECAVEEAIQQIEKHGGTTTVLTLGPAAAEEQLRDALAMGVDSAILLETDGREWDPAATAGAIIETIRAKGNFDLILFGNESADTGGYQVGIRVAHALDLPCVSGAKSIEIKDGQATAKREASGGWEVYEVPLPAVITVKEGLNLPRYPSMPGRLKAKKKPLDRVQPQFGGNTLERVRLKLPKEAEHQVEILGKDAQAAAKAVEIFQKLGLI